MRILLLVVGLAGLFNSNVFSANDGGTESPFSLGAGARELGMGSADLANSGFETSPYWNPSRLAQAQQYQFSGFHSRLFDSDVAYQYFGLVAPTLDFGIFGVGIFRLGVNGIELRDVNNFLLGETDNNQLGLYFAYARSFSKFDFGTALTLEHHSLADYSATSTPGINFSVSRRLQPKSDIFEQLTIAFNVKNAVKPSIELDNESVSSPVAVMLSTTLGVKPLKDRGHDLLVAFSIGKSEKISPVVSVGLEYGFNDLLYLRSGLNKGNFAAGIGIKYSAVTFDYALVDRDLDFLHTFSLTTSFGKPVKQRQEARLAKREEDFRKLMGRQLAEKNAALAQSMTKEGKKYLENGRLNEAVSTLEKAMFMAKANELDTSSISLLLKDANLRLDEAVHLKQYREYIDSASTAFSRKDFISSKYFASLALEQQPNSTAAQKLIDSATDEISLNLKRDDIITQRLVKADSLLNYGKIAEAIVILNGLKQHYGVDTRIQQPWKKAHFERFKAKATQLHSQRDLAGALLFIDSALQIFPNHEWCLTTQSVIKGELASSTKPKETVVVATSTRISEQLQKEAEQEYEIAQAMFTKGDLAGAIDRWERTEKIAPNFKSVRNYLLKAYKFLGVEYYGKGELQQAIAVWKKASLLSPNNEEISNYIKRTETELGKLEQLSYESQ